MEVSKNNSQLVRLDASLVEKIEDEEMVLVSGGKNALIEINIHIHLNFRRGCSADDK